MDQYFHWREAIEQEKPIETGDREDGTYVRSGFYRALTKQGVEAIAFWRGDDGHLQCRRTIYGDGSKLSIDEMEELFSQVCRYPIEHNIWQAVRAGSPFPAEYETRLTMQEIRDGVAWTAKLRQAKLGVESPAEADTAENPRAVIGDNQPPEPTPAEALAARVEALKERRAGWLKEIGGSIQTQEHADKAAAFADAFSKLEAEATEAHRVEKAPHLESGRKVDAAWKPVISAADDAKRACKTLLTPYLKRKADEAAELKRKAAMEAAMAGEKASQDAAKPGAGHGRRVTLRTVQRAIITDLPALAAFLSGRERPNEEFVEICRKLAERMLKAGVDVPGAKIEERQEAA
jgi:hypothetical protein